MSFLAGVEIRAAEKIIIQTCLSLACVFFVALSGEYLDSPA